GFPLELGDVLLMESSGGGGFGDPLERDPARVAADVGEGYVTPAAAEAIYGVVFRDGTPDVSATAAKRAALRAARLRVRVTAGSRLDSPRRGGGRLRSHPAARPGGAQGAGGEVVKPPGAPFRAAGPARRAPAPAA